MPSLPIEGLSLVRAGELHGDSAPRRPPRFGYAMVAGRLVEIPGGAGSASLALLFSLIVEAQSLKEPVVWVGLGNSVFFPPDAAATGVDLDALAVIRAGCINEALRAVHHLLHSGAFGIVALDAGEERVPQGLLGRYARLADKNATALLCLTEGSIEPTAEQGLGSMISLRVKTRLHRESPGVFRCTLDVIKDKLQGPGLHTAEVYHAPPGLR